MFSSVKAFAVDEKEEEQDKEVDKEVEDSCVPFNFPLLAEGFEWLVGFAQGIATLLPLINCLKVYVVITQSDS